LLSVSFGRRAGSGLVIIRPVRRPTPSGNNSPSIRARGPSSWRLQVPAR